MQTGQGYQKIATNQIKYINLQIKSNNENKENDINKFKLVSIKDPLTSDSPRIKNENKETYSKIEFIFIESFLELLLL